MSAAALRELAARLPAEYGDVAEAAAHELRVLADVLSGTHRRWADSICPHCRVPLSQRNGTLEQLAPDVFQQCCTTCAPSDG